MAEKPGCEAGSQIPVETFIKKFNVEDPKVLDLLHRFPTLCYLLGNTAPETIIDSKDGVAKTKFVLQDGSGMFGLKNPEEALEWKGIFNHIVGSVRHVNFIARKIASATEEQKQKLAKLGYDINSITNLDSDLLLGFMLVSHAGRRKMDEHSNYNIHNSPLKDPDNSDRTGHSFLYTVELLDASDANHNLVDLMRVEDHVYEVQAAKTGVNPNIVDNILTYCDWTYGQEPIPLGVRFQGLRQSGRQTKEILDVLETAGTNFENVLKKVFGEDIYEQMADSQPFPGEREVRSAYTSSAGLTLTEVYPDFAAKYTS